MIKHFVSYNKHRCFKITSVEEDLHSGNYLIIFFESQKMSSISVKSAKEIMENDKLINKFSPTDAAKIGQLLAESQYKKILKNRGKSNV